MLGVVKKQRPQAMLNGTTTRSPRFSVLTSRPASSTTPVNSWPKVQPTRVSGTQAVQKVEVRTADGGAGDPEDDVLGVLDAGVGLQDHRDLPRAEVGECAHGRNRLGSPSCPGHPLPGPPSGGRP